MPRFRNASSYLAVGLMFLLAPGGWAQPPPAVVLPPALTLDDAIHIFRTHGLELVIAEAAASSAEGDVRIAHQVFNPNFGYSFSRIFNYNPATVCPADPNQGSDPSQCSPNVLAFSLSDNAAIEDALAGKRNLRIGAANAALRAARLARVDAQRNLEFQVKAQYIQAVLAQDSLDFAIEVQRGWQTTFELSRLRYQKGAISERDEAQIETAKLEAEQAVSQARQGLAVAKLELAFLLGVRDRPPEFEVDHDLPRFVVPPPLASATAESLLNIAFDTRPDLKSLKAQEERAGFALRAAKRSRFPDLALQLGFAYAGSGGPVTSSNTTPPTLTVGVSGNIPFFYQQQGEIRKAEADLTTQSATLAKARAQVLSDVATAHANYTASRDRVERMEQRLLDRVRLQRDLTKLMYEKGATSLLEYLEAQRTYISTNVEYLADLAGYWTAIYQVEQATGMEIRK